MSPCFDAAEAARIPGPAKADLVFDIFPVLRSYLQMPPSPLTYTEPSRPRTKARLNLVVPSGALKTSFFVPRSSPHKALPLPASRLHHHTPRWRSSLDVAVQRGP